jgi:hypothetical protein
MLLQSTDNLRFLGAQAFEADRQLANFRHMSAWGQSRQFDHARAGSTYPLAADEMRRRTIRQIGQERLFKYLMVNGYFKCKADFILSLLDRGQGC